MTRQESNDKIRASNTLPNDKRKRRDELIRIGSMMSNMCFNIKQWKEIPERVRTTAKELQEEWDKVKYGK